MAETYLSNHDEICPAVLDTGGFKCPFSNCDAFIFDCAGEDFAHSLAGLDGLDLIDA